MKPILIQQEDPNGCGIACVAMLTGLSYAEVRRMVVSHHIENGMSVFGVFQLLTELGYAVAMKTRGYGLPFVRDVWPPSPWADAHLCEVHPYDGARRMHFVVMLADGTVLDPALGYKTLSDYADVFTVAAVVKMHS